MKSFSIITIPCMYCLNKNTYLSSIALLLLAFSKRQSGSQWYIVYSYCTVIIFTLISRRFMQTLHE
ncbi:hypothetical protein V8C35DRAFT_232524 [Trichoderma chlorosporum]